MRYRSECEYEKIDQLDIIWLKKIMRRGENCEV